LFAQAYAKVPEERILFVLKMRDIIAVAEEMLNGELEYRLENYDKAFEHLKEAVRRDD
jgi:hypothetical protein